MSGFFPMDRNLVSSSVWALGSPEAFKVWTYLLLSADPRTGVVPDSDPAIALRCGLTPEAAGVALDWLQSPDPYSRTKDHDGRRLVRNADGRLVVANYMKYRGKDYSTPRVQRWRARKVAASRGVGGSRCNRSTVTNVSRNEEQEQEQEQRTLGSLMLDGTGKEHSSGSNSSLADARPARVVASQIRQVFDHWKAVMGHPHATLTKGREKAIRKRLQEGYSVERIKLAVDGCRASPFHQGANKDQAVWDDLTLICRSGEKVEAFIAMIEDPVKHAQPKSREQLREEETARNLKEWVAEGREG